MLQTSQPIVRASLACLLLLGGLPVASGCDAEVTGGAILPDLHVTSVGPSPIVPGSRLVISGGGFVVDDVASLAVVFRGTNAGEAIEFAVVPERTDDGTLIVPIEGAVRGALIRPSGRFEGSVEVIRTPRVDAVAESTSAAVSLRTEERLTPSLVDYTPKELFVGDTIALVGDGFLHPSEGTTVLTLDGVMTADSPFRTTEVRGLQLPIAPPSADRRDAAGFELTADVFGILPGRFSGFITVENVDLNGEITTSEPLTIDSWELQAPYIDEMVPRAASRGQWITLTGRGFSPPDGLLQVVMILVLEGHFTAIDGTVIDLMGPRAVNFVPDRFDGNTECGAVVRVDVDTDGELTGLGLVPGTFEGTIAPMLLFGADKVRGDGVDIIFEIKPQKQVVYIKLLPSFDDALLEFGLLAERDAVKARILEVVHRDYQGISIAFTLSPPDDFAEYGIVEVAGRDPNGTGLFGLDNTTGKDVGNIRFDDIIGGYNAETSADGYAAYGGVFPAEFMNFSQASNSPLANSRFDDIFAPVAPALGGVPAADRETSGGDPRAAEIREAVRVFANLTGGTISHEVGHSLGLSAVAGQFHNLGDNDGWLMDGGASRPLEERAELDGQGPGFFSPKNQAYLQQILPTL